MAEVRREELINLSEAAKRVGLALSRMRARVEAGVLPAFRDPLDSRALLVQIEDVDWLRQPAPIVPERDKESRPTRSSRSWRERITTPTCTPRGKPSSPSH